MIQSPAIYPDLAAKIVDGRTAKGLSQTAFAAELGLKQQTVSRWEAGTHRPEITQLPALGTLIGTDASVLMKLGEYGSSVAFSQSTLFPVDALDPSSFEHFVADVVRALEPGAVVRLQGSRGHKQDGTDVIAKFPDGRIWSFQCKRMSRFGAAEAEKAVAYHNIEAEKAVLVISKIVAPAVVQAVEAHPGWTVWDKQYLSQKIRSLPMEFQQRLVDQYFRGQRMALLGRSEPGPWQTQDEYFSPFAGRASFFSHDWSLAGRTAEIGQLLAHLAQDGNPVTLLTAPGGMGKTRLLKGAVQAFADLHANTAIRFLSTAREADARRPGRFGHRPEASGR